MTNENDLDLSPTPITDLSPTPITPLEIKYVVGVFVSSRLHNENLVKAMINGWIQRKYVCHYVTTIYHALSDVDYHN